MEHTLAVFNGHHAQVSRYYSQGEWHDVPPGDPPILVLADKVSPKKGSPKKGSPTFMITRDVEAGGVYDECGYLMGYGHESIPTFEELEAAARMSNLYGHGTYDRRVFIFVGGREPLRPALITFAGNQTFKWSTSPSWIVDSLNSRFEAFGLPPANAVEVGDKTVLFDFDAEAVPTTP